jgi:hypothetical protein
MIETKGIEHMGPDIRILQHKGLTCEVRSDGRFFTVYQDDKPVGTLTRPMVYAQDRSWEVHATDGTLIHRSRYKSFLMSALWRHLNATT